jgi:hypothetical protein
MGPLLGNDREPKNKRDNGNCYSTASEIRNSTEAVSSKFDFDFVNVALRVVGGDEKGTQCLEV